MNVQNQNAAARLRRVYAGEYLLDVYPQLPGTLLERALEMAERDRGMDERTLARAWLEDAEIKPDVTAG